MTAATLTGKRRQILEFIANHIQQSGYPPSVREIGEAVGLSSSSTVHTHLQLLQREGYLRRDPTKPRTLTVSFEPSSGAQIPARPVAHVPLVGDVAAGTGVLAEENVEEVLPIAEDLTGPGRLFMLRVRGESMIGAGIFDGDLVVVRADAPPRTGDIVVAGIPDGEATVKTLRREGRSVVLEAANPEFAPLVFGAGDVTIYGKVVTVLRRL